MSAPETILIIDDDPLNRVTVCAALGSRYRVLEAGDAAAGYQALASHDVDLVLLDVMLPGVSGYQACRRIKQEHGHRYLPVLLLTALDGQEDRNDGLETGADDFLSKPFDRRELNLRVDVFLKLRRQERTIREQLTALDRVAALKDDLVSLILHDLRNPLTGLTGYLSMLELGVTDPVQLEDVRGARAAARRLKDSIDDLLRVRSLEEGQLRAHPETVELGGLLAEACAALAGAAREHDVTLVHAAPPGATFACDRKLVLRALENLVVNAIKYSSRGDKVEISARFDDRQVHVEVADRGPGVSESARTTLFAKFGALGAATDARRGFGLGLYMVSLVARAHGGAIAARDREGGGTIFCLSLPAEAAA